MGQGVQTGALVGRVTSDGQPLAGALVTVTSEKLQGERAAASETSGEYILRALPPGQYRVVFSMEGMDTVERTVDVPLGGTARADAVMAVTAATETVIVTEEAPSALETTTTGANFTKETIDQLPVFNRSLINLGLLAGGVNDNTPLGVPTISGGFSYDNVFMVNGVDITDRIFGDPDDLYIEDALEEVQVMSSGISAEYGRFSGGVINAITKSGSNKFEGSFRTDFQKPNWRDETPVEKENHIQRDGKLGKTYEATLGGRIVTDRLWFFASGRDRDEPRPSTLAVSQLQVDRHRKTERWEGKLTFALTQSHSLKASYINNDVTDTHSLQLNPLEPDAVAPAKLPNDAWAVSYDGTFTASLFGELRYSEKHFGFRGPGNSSTILSDNVFIALGIFPGVESGAYNAPYFDVTDPEDRDNQQLYGALSYFLSTTGGSHDMKVGFESFTDIGVGGNSQSPTSLVFYTDYLTDAEGNPVLDSTGHLQPRWEPGFSYIAYWDAKRGARSEITANSVFVNDRWNVGSHWSFNLGARYEKLKLNADDAPTVSSDSIVPRLAASFDPKGDGKWKLDVTYAQYAGRATKNQFGAASPQGNPALAYGVYYYGPAGIGTNFAPGFDLANYFFYYFSSPTQTVQVDPGLKNPRTREFTVAGGLQLPRGGYVKATYIDRDVKDFIETLIDHRSDLVLPTVGPVTPAQSVEAQRLTNSDVPKRQYQALLLEGQLRLAQRWSLGGNWTHQFKNDGNFEGESGQLGPIDSTFGDYPEVFTEARNYPVGHLDDFEADRVRLWTDYSFDFGRGGAVDAGLLLKYDSPLTFSYAAVNVPLSPSQRSAGAGYRSLPGTQTLFFGERGAGEYNDVWSADLALTYSVPIWRQFMPYLKVTVTNVTNEDTAIKFNTSVSADRNGPKDANGLPTSFVKGPNFGKATASSNYQIPREFFVSAGFRF
jgi:hypothetical protein